jgi:hypothetical protein
VLQRTHDREEETVTDDIRIPVADVEPRRHILTDYVERIQLGPGGTIDEFMPNQLRTYTGILNIVYPETGYAGGDRPIDAQVISFIPYSDGTLQDWDPRQPPEAVVTCSVAGFRVCEAKDGDENGGVFVTDARVFLRKQPNLADDPTVTLLKVNISVRGGNFFSIAYHVTLKGRPMTRLSPFDPGDARPEGKLG